MLGFGPLGSAPLGAIPQRFPDRSPEILLQAELLHGGNKVAEGVLVRAAAIPWLEIVKELDNNPEFLFEFVRHPRKFEEFIAACYERAGFDEVVLTPQRGDGGVDVIATKHGYGSVRFLEQTKAYSPGHLVTHADVREMLGVLSMDQNASKGLITTTSEFEPGVLKENSNIRPFLPHRLELKNGNETLKWIKSIAKNA
ncbi:MAG: restriction endonuclease [Novosphingobium sp.]|nr:restriction endonuclease [Novosphingobium sp.]MCP5401314.1 restriction endonuclease [Novosphingobium sp.]